MNPLCRNPGYILISVLSEKAALSRKYTNHSLRATSIHLLDAGNIPTRHIMSVTGHKAKSSLKSYTGHTDNNTKLEDLKVLRRSPDLFNNIKTGQGQLQFIIKHILFNHNMGVAAILVRSLNNLTAQ